MRIHIQTDHDRQRQLTASIWEAAVARAPDIGGGHEVSFGATREALIAALAEVELLIVTAISLRPLPAAAPRLRLVFCTYAGVDTLMPLDWLPEGAVLLNNSGTHEAKAGEYAIMALLMLANLMPMFVANQHAQRWQRRRSTLLAGRRLTIVGLGSLGSGAARRARQFDMDVTGVRFTQRPHPDCDRVVDQGGLDTILNDTQFLLLACPLTPATRHILDARRIALLPAEAGVINIGRGDLVEQDALCDALDAGTLGGAVLDVFTPEPVPPDHRLWTTRNLLMTPHVSSDDSDAYYANSLDILITNLRALRDGRPLPNAVDPSRGY